MQTSTSKHKAFSIIQVVFAVLLINSIICCCLSNRSCTTAAVIGVNGFSRVVIPYPRSCRWKASLSPTTASVPGGTVSSRTSYDSNRLQPTILQLKSMTTTRTTARLLSPEQSQDGVGGGANDDDGVETPSPTTMATPTALSSSQQPPLPQHEHQQQDQAQRQEQEPPTFRKDHTLTVCMVPPPDAVHVWDVVSQMRKELKDPGYYRWPPHANLLYPFLVWKDKTKKKDSGEIDGDETAQDNDNDPGDDELSSILHKLKEATSKVEPFHVHLNPLGTFGGKQRGVLWLYPYSQFQQHREEEEEQSRSAAAAAVDNEDNVVKKEQEDVIQTASESDEEPLKRLQRYLEEAFPMCRDQRKGGKFQPHMTLSHFENLTDAELAKDKIYDMFPNIRSDDRSLRFTLDRIYLLQRKGDMGQFLRVAEIGLGSDGTNIVSRFDPAQPFPGMPKEEESWVYEERMKLKARRNNNGRRGGWKGQRGRRGGGQRSRSPRVPDTPEVIAQKRAERKAKKERLEQEERLSLLSQQQQAERDGVSHDDS